MCEYELKFDWKEGEKLWIWNKPITSILCERESVRAQPERKLPEVDFCCLKSLLAAWVHLWTLLVQKVHVTPNLNKSAVASHQPQPQNRRRITAPLAAGELQGRMLPLRVVLPLMEMTFATWKLKTSCCCCRSGGVGSRGPSFLSGTVDQDQEHVVRRTASRGKNWKKNLKVPFFSKF